MLTQTIRTNDLPLQCPCCGEYYLHHDKVEVFSRKSEDQEGIRSVTQESGRTFVDTDMRDNPSRRRDGLKIHFWCESCDKKSFLTFRQHKGSTYLEWANASPGQAVL